jgi:circadian clock protein KaiB
MPERYDLRLYVAGALPGSARAVEALKTICEDYLSESYDLEVIDVYQQPQLALDEQIDAVPMLVKRSPAPVRRILGDLSDKEHVLLGLDLKPRAHEEKRRPAKKP